MADYQKLQQLVTQHLAKALDHLEYSFNKVKQLPLDYKQMDDEIMETWESFSSRFARVADIFMMKYIHTKLLIGDPAYEGTLRDYLNKAEQMDLIDDANQWIEIRELRNVAAHEYNDEDLSSFYKKLLLLCPMLLNLKEKI